MIKQWVQINGFKWFVDTDKQMLFEDEQGTSGTDFKFLTPNELSQIKNQIKYGCPMISY